MKYSSLLYLGIFFMFSMIWACGSGSSVDQEQVSEPTSELTKIEALRVQLSQALAQKNSWKSHWTSSLGNFDESDFQFVSTDSIDPMEMPESNPIKEGDPLFPYQFPHPEGNGTIDIYSYKVEAQETLDQPFLNPDSEVVWYRKDGMKERLLFMGPSGMFEDGVWLSPAEFLVFGFFQEEDGFRPMAWVVDVENDLITQFKLQTLTKDYKSESYLNAKLKSVDLKEDGI